MLERDYQAKLIKRIKAMLPGAIVLKNDPNYIQGIPDLIVLFDEWWAALEVKVSATARHRPNQNHYVDQMDEMSFAAFIYPENEKEVLDALQRSFQARR